MQPAVTINADDRAYIGLTLPNSPTLVGAALHVQAGTLSGPVVSLTNPDSMVMH